MASELSNYFANAILAWCGGTAMPAAPATVYVALWNGDPTAAANAGTEVTTQVRAAGRIAVPLTAVANRARANSGDIDFGTAAAGTQVTHGAIFTSQAGGNMLWSSPLNNARTIVLGDPVVIPAGDLSFNFN